MHNVHALPWYRQGWPWFLISIPMASIVMGFVMLFLALQSNNSMVVDDYYKAGKAINQRIERDQRAAVLGLTATLSQTSDALIMNLQAGRHESGDESTDAVQQTHSFIPPQSLLLRWVHVTQAERDDSAVLEYLGGGRYAATGVNFPENGIWRLHLQPVDAPRWRLVSERLPLGSDPLITLQARSMGDHLTSGAAQSQPSVDSSPEATQ